MIGCLCVVENSVMFNYLSNNQTFNHKLQTSIKVCVFVTMLNGSKPRLNRFLLGQRFIPLTGLVMTSQVVDL